MLTYIWICVMLRAAVPGADHFIAQSNAAISTFMGAHIADTFAPTAERPRFDITTERRDLREVRVALAR